MRNDSLFRTVPTLLTVVLLLGVWGPPATADVSGGGDGSSDELIGLCLSVVNIMFATVTAGHIGDHTASPTTTGLGFAVGFGSIALSLTDQVGLDPLVVITGVITATISYLGASGRAPDDREPMANPGLSVGPRIVPLAGCGSDGAWRTGLAVTGSF